MRACRYTNETRDPDSGKLHVVSEHVPYQRCLAESGIRFGLAPSLLTYCHDWSTRYNARRTFILANGSVTSLTNRHAKASRDWVATRPTATRPVTSTLFRRPRPLHEKLLEKPSHKADDGAIASPNGTAGSRRRTVLISQMLSARDIFMYSPVVDTLKRGFEALGARVRIHAGPTGAVRSAGSLLLGDVLIFVGMCGGVCGKLPLVKLGKRGVLRIKYNTEPSVNANGTTSLPRCLTHGEFDEVWDYSLANIAPCVPDSLRGRRHALAVNNGSNGRRLVFRHVPPGAMASLSLPPRASAGHTPRRAAAFMGMLPSAGTAYASTSRSHCYTEIHAAVGGAGQLVHRNNVWNYKSLENVVITHAVFLNLHKGCRNTNSPLETLRLAPLLSAGAHVVSERAYAADEADYSEWVTFSTVDRLPAVLNATLSLASRRDRVAESKAREARVTTFLRRFSPSEVRLLIQQHAYIHVDDM